MDAFAQKRARLMAETTIKSRVRNFTRHLLAVLFVWASKVANCGDLNFTPTFDG
jgi:hypothetical protein